MTTYFISRHPGAITWVEQQGYPIDRLVPHLDIAIIQKGDKVIGTLPANLATRICEIGGRYFHLSLKLPAEMRGKELSADDMQRYGAIVEEYLVQKLPLRDDE